MTNKRESTWLVVQRCLAIVLRLQQGSATKMQLINFVKSEVGRDAYGFASDKALTRRFEGDKERLRRHFDIQIKYNKEAKGYLLKKVDRPLLNVSDSELETLAFLMDTFQLDSSHSLSVQQLIDLLVGWMPASQQDKFQKLRGIHPDIDLRTRDSEEITKDVWDSVLEAYNAKQLLSFDYLSISHEEAIPRYHEVEPWGFYFSSRGHWILRGFCRFNDGPHGAWQPRDYINYRLSRIMPASVKIFPEKLGVRPLGKPKEVKFKLSPQVARFGVSRRAELDEEPKITPLLDGWVQVEGRTYDLFDLARNLLYYGKNCQVLGGFELLQEMEMLTKELTEMYLINH